MKKHEAIINILERDLDNYRERIDLFVDKEVKAQSEGDTEAEAKYHRYVMRNLEKYKTLEKVLKELIELGYTVDESLFRD